MIIKIISGIAILGALLIALYIVYPPHIPSSPISVTELSSPKQLSPTKSYVVLGFLPYWNTKKISEAAISNSTHIAYFTLRLSGDGQLVTNLNRREEEPGYTNYKRLEISDANYKKNLILTFAQQDQEALTTLLRSKSARLNAIKTIVEYTNRIGGVGVNIDFEPLGEITNNDKNNFSIFMKDLGLELGKNNLLVSVSIYASAVSNPRIWDLPNLKDSVDYFVVMAYDYTLPGSAKTGPNSPLRGAGTLFEHDIVSNLAEITAQLPAKQVLLGIPFYGYEWDVIDSEKYTLTESRGSLASLDRIQKMVDEKTLELLWDRNSLTPYAIRRENGKVVSQIYYEDVNSIRLKLDLVKQAGLGGIAIWALGYEGDNPSLWTEISHSLSLP